MISINQPTQPVLKGDRVEFRATVSDPDDDNVTLQWAHKVLDPNDRCPANPDPRTFWPNIQRVAREIGTPHEVLAVDEAFCVAAFAKDSHGAVKAAAVQVDPASPAPQAVIELIDPKDPPPFLLYAEIRFSGAMSTGNDPDQLHHEWTLEGKPPLSQRDLDVGCGTSDRSLACFNADIAGMYTVGLVVSEEGEGGNVVNSDKVTRSFLVADDQLPCLETEPDALTSVVEQERDKARTFRVNRVIDDGDPYPFQNGPLLGVPHFSWFEGPPGGPLKYIGNDAPEFTLSAEHSLMLGAEVVVRVEITDRNEARIRAVLNGCGDDASCAGKPGCLQRVSWKVRYR